MRWLLLCAWLPLALLAGEEPQDSTAQSVAARVGPEIAPAMVAAQEDGLGLPPYEAKYSVRYGGIKVGEMTQRLSAPANGMQSLQTIAYTTGMASWLKKHRTSEISVWRVREGELLPLSYSYRYKGRSKETVERLDFDWAKGEVVSTRNDRTIVLEAERGTLDKHFLQLVLRHDLMHGDGALSYRVADRGVLKQYDFEVLGEEAVQNDTYGTLQCIKIRRGSTLFWVAPHLNYLPVKIEKDEGGATAGTYLMDLQTL